MSNTHHIPKGYHSVTPYLIVDNAAAAIEFYKKALGATLLFKMDAPGGKIAHAEIKIGDSPIMLGDEHPQEGHKSPKAYGGTSVSLMIYVEDVDAVAEKAVQMGMKVKKPVANQFYGDRSGFFEDPYGHYWSIATHVEDVSEEELKKRTAKLFG